MPAPEPSRPRGPIGCWTAGDANRTAPTGADVEAFVAAVPDAQRREDAQRLVEVLGEASGQPPQRWGTSIIGFGSRHYQYESGREGHTHAVGFSPCKAQTVLYLTGGPDQYADLPARLGRHRTGKGDLFVAPDRTRVGAPPA